MGGNEAEEYQNGMSLSSWSAGWDEVPASCIAASPAAIDGSAAAGAPLPLGLSRNLTPPPGTSRISVE
jgi:hypothetical protein